MSFSVSGLTTGLDVSSMVSQLMQVERSQGSSLLTGQKAAQGLVSTLTSLNTQMKSLGDAARAFAPTSALDVSAFKATSAKSSDESIAKVTSTNNAASGSLTFKVTSIAAAGSTIGDKSHAAETVLNGGAAFDFKIRVGDKDTTAEGAEFKETTIQIGANSKLADVVSAINQQAGADVKASMVQVATGTYKLQIESVATGAKSNVNVVNASAAPTVPDILGNFLELSSGKNTVLSVGEGSAGAYEITSTTREVKDALSGLTINPVKVDPTAVTVSMSTDLDGLASKVESLVKAANEALGTISKNSTWDATSKKGGVLLGDSTARQITADVSSAFTGSASYSPVMAGIELQRDGSIKFDKAKFTAAYEKDAAAVTKNVTELSTKLVEVSKNASNTTDGMLTVRINGEQATVKDYTDRIARFEDRMTAKQALYKQQFSALDSMLSKLQAQGSWLTGQLASLPTG